MKVITTRQYDRAEKKYKKKHYPIKKIDDCVEAIVKHDVKFLKDHKDHKIGKVRELHIDRQYNDDWLLIYQVFKDKMVLLLVSTGDHDSLNRILHN